jgi:dipeptidyl aminopeptidase/acylaminoacyl peptidase
MRFPLAVALAVLPGTLAAGEAPPSPGAVLDRGYQVRRFPGTAISPDGSVLLWTVRQGEKGGTITLRAQGKTRVLTAGKEGVLHREGEATFSPDGKWVAFLSDAQQDGQMQVYLAGVDGGAPVALTSVEGQLGDLRFSPDGKSLGVLFVKGSSQETGALVAYKPDSGPVGETPEEQRVAVIDLQSHAFREVSPENRYVYDYDWSPDSRSMALEATEGSGTNNYWVAELDLLDVQKGTLARLWKPPLQLACPRFAPDGARVAVIHGIMSDEGSNGGDVYEVPVRGGEAKNLTPGMKASAKWLQYTSRGELFFLEDVDGEMGIGKVGTAGAQTVYRSKGRLSHVAIATNGTASVAVQESEETPPEVVAGQVGYWTPVTRENASLTADWGRATSVHFVSDGQSVQGWLLPPKVVEQGRTHPMVVMVHGGPSAAATVGWPTGNSAVLLSQGYFLFYPNPRGSFGQGEAFAEANVKDFGYGDFRDIMAGVDAVVKTAPVDPKRLGLWGWSYGGYMGMWVVTQTDRFAAVVAGAGIVNWQSYYGQNRIDRWMIPFFGSSVYEDPWIYARSSPISFIKAAKTPTLVLHGDRDSEVPTPQGYEFWHALRSLGVPTQLVIYEGEGHGFRKREHSRDVALRTLAWFQKYLGGS